MKEDLVKRRSLAYKLNCFDDTNLPFVFKEQGTEEIIEQVLHFFNNESLLIYPAKSYFVAIVYSFCMQKYFGIDFIEALNDEQLLFDDPYFVPYSKSKHIYDSILCHIDGSVLEKKSCTKTVNYFKQEFMVED